MVLVAYVTYWTRNVLLSDKYVLRSDLKKKLKNLYVLTYAQQNELFQSAINELFIYGPLEI